MNVSKMSFECYECLKDVFCMFYKRSHELAINDITMQLFPYLSFCGVFFFFFFFFHFSQNTSLFSSHKFFVYKIYFCLFLFFYECAQQKLQTTEKKSSSLIGWEKKRTIEWSRCSSKKSCLFSTVRVKRRTRRTAFIA